MSVQATALVLMLLELVFLLLAVPTLTILEWRARSRSTSGDADSEPAPAERAEALLRELLDEREYQQLRRRGYVDVASAHDPQRVYRIPAYTGLVRVYEHGTAICELCLQSVEPMPSAEIVLMHKLMIQGDEARYRACAREYVCDPDLHYQP
jgi:hypothetical protein